MWLRMLERKGKRNERFCLLADALDLVIFGYEQERR